MLVITFSLELLSVLSISRDARGAAFGSLKNLEMYLLDASFAYRVAVPKDRGLLLKGGNPAAPSGTATLLRLSPSQRSCFRRRGATSSTPFSHGLTGGVYKARERIHRGVLTHDY